MTRQLLRNTAYALAVSVAILALPGAAAMPQSNPLITAVAPADLMPAAKAQTLRVTGQDFLQGLTLEVKNPAGQSVILPAKEIRARTSTGFEASVTLATAGTYSLIVTNTDGGISPAFPIKVSAREKKEGPVITRITPAEPTKRQEPQPLNIEGSGFVSGLRVIVTDPMGIEVTEATVGKVTPNSFELVVRLQHAGEYGIVVNNPSGAVSDVFRLLVR